MPAASYFADYSAISQSALKDFADRRRKYEAYYVTRTQDRPEPTDAMRKGTALHTALLEPDHFDELVVVYPASVLDKKGNCTTNASDDFYNKHTALGQCVLKQSQYDGVRLMAESIKRVLGQWLDLDGSKEKSIYWTDELTGLPLKMRLDWLVHSKQPVVFDFKSTTDASPNEFRHACERLGYGIQQAQYVDGVEQAIGCTPLFYFVAVENKFPYACSINEIDSSSVEQARMYRNRLLGELKDCIVSQDWSEPWEGKINSLTLRQWCFEAE